MKNLTKDIPGLLGLFDDPVYRHLIMGGILFVNVGSGAMFVRYLFTPSR